MASIFGKQKMEIHRMPIFTHPRAGGRSTKEGHSKYMGQGIRNQGPKCSLPADVIKVCSCAGQTKPHSKLLHSLRLSRGTLRWISRPHAKCGLPQKNVEKFSGTGAAFAIRCSLVSRPRSLGVYGEETCWLRGGPHLLERTDRHWRDGSEGLLSDKVKLSGLHELS